MGCEVLSEFERAERARIESEMERAHKAHGDTIGRLLLEIKEKRLWRDTHESFDAYVEDRHKISRSYAWFVAGVADVRRDIPEPLTTKQAKPLIALPTEERKAVWEDAKSAAGDGKVTPKHVQEAVSAAKARPKKPGPNASHDEIESYLRATGMVAEGGSVVTYNYADPDAEDEEPEESRELTDEEWLATLPAREKLPADVRRNFDADALYFRNVTPFRVEYAEKSRPFASKAKKSTSGHIGAWMAKTYRYFQINDPSRWEVCDDCGGTGRLTLIGKCPKCRGEGYTL